MLRPLRCDDAKVPRMIKPTRAPNSTRIAVLACLACIGAACLAPAAALAETTITYTHESMPAYEQQLASGQIQSATFNKRVRSLHLTLKNGTHVLVHYPAHDEPTLNAALTAKGIPVAVLKPAAAEAEAKKAPVHHKLRYIAGGILIVIVIVVGGVLLYDRRRKRLAE